MARAFFLMAVSKWAFALGSKKPRFWSRFSISFVFTSRCTELVVTGGSPTLLRSQFRMPFFFLGSPPARLYKESFKRNPRNLLLGRGRTSPARSVFKTLRSLRDASLSWMTILLPLKSRSFFGMFFVLLHELNESDKVNTQY